MQNQFRIVPNAIYQHYKGGKYKVLMVAQHTENPNEELVIYESLETGKIWARPIQIFCSGIIIEDEVLKRFQLIKK